MPAQSRLPEKLLHVPENAVRGIVVEQVEDFHFIVGRIKRNEVHAAAFRKHLEGEIKHLKNHLHFVSFERVYLRDMGGQVLTEP